MQKYHKNWGNRGECDGSLLICRTIEKIFEICYYNAIEMIWRCNSMSFSSDIKKVRQKSLLSQEAFAQAVGVSFTTVNRWESGKCKPTFKTMKLIDDFCKAQGIDFNISDELLEEE